MRGITEEDIKKLIDTAHELGDDSKIEAWQTLFACCKELTSWQPINEHTPKDRPILLFYPQHYGGIFSGYYVNGRFCCESDALYDDTPTHWQELPEDPK